MKSSAPRHRFVPALEGLRGVAVLLVVAFHAGTPWMPGGFVGVEVFFVLSGFLITTILLREIDATGGLSLLPFYLRRAWRLLPALVLLLGCILALWLLLGEWQEFATSAEGAVAALFYFTNWADLFGWQTGFFSHTWSLSIEEQFYLVWPLVLLAIVRRTGRYAMWAVAALALALWVRNALLAPHVDPIALYLGTFSRAPALLAGAVLGIAYLRYPAVVDRGARAAGGASAGLAAAGIGLASLVASPQQPLMYVVGFPLVGLASVVLIAASLGSESTALHRALGSWALRYVGRISYGLYLWHYPVFLLLNPSPWWIKLTLGTAVSMAIAALSFHHLERPLLERHNKRDDRVHGVPAPA